MKDIDDILYSTKPVEDEEKVKSGLLEELLDLMEGPQNAEGIVFTDYRFAQNKGISSINKYDANTSK